MFLTDLIRMGSFTLNHTWHSIDFLMVLECCLLMIVASLLLAAMSKRLRIFAVASSIFWATAAFAANSTLTALTASGAVAGTDTYYTVQTPGAGGVKSTAAKIATYINSLFSGDATVAPGGAVTFATVNGNIGTFGSATQCTVFTTNAKGLITAASQVTCTPGIASLTGAGTGVLTALAVNVGTAGSFVVNGGALGTPSSGLGTNLTGTAAGLTAGTVTTNANLTGAITSTGNATLLGSFSSANLLAALTTKTGTGNAVFGSAPTIDSLNATTAMTLAYLAGGGIQCLQSSNTGAVTGTGSACGSGSAGVASAVGGIGVTVTGTGSPATGAITISSPVTVTNNTGTTDTITSANKGTVVTENNAASIAVAITTAGFVSTDYFTVKNKGAGLATYTPSSGTIDGSGTLTLKQNQSADIYFDGTNYWTLPGRSTNVACADLTNAGALCSTTSGTGVATAAANALSAAGGLTTTIGSTTLAMATSAIASGACTSAQPATVTNTATTDTVLVGFNGDPTAVTGFAPVTTGMLTVIAYPAANTVNIKECNNTSASITPGAHTFNIRVVR